MYRTLALRSLVLACGLATAFTAAAHAEPVEAVYVTSFAAPTSPKSAVPGGLVGVADPRFTNFNRLVRTPSTNKWATVATTNATDATTDQIFILGSGLNATIQIREGSVIPGNTETLALTINVPRINDAEQWAVAFPGGSVTATSNYRMLKWDGSSFIVLHPADPIPALPGSLYTGTFNGSNISSTGAIAFEAGINGFTASSAFSADGTTTLINNGVDVPTGQMTGSPAAWATITADGFWQDASGSHYIARGTVGTDTTTNSVIVVDGAVVVQKGFVVPGSTFTSPVTSVADVWMESNSDWFARGANVDGQNWLLRNGVVIAASGTPITPGNTELWASSSTAFRDVKGDNRGNWIISGHTNNPSTLLDDVLVLNGTHVLARESDPIDLNNNGQFEGSLFIHTMQSDRSTFSSDGYYYFATRVKSSATGTTGAGGSNNSSLLRVRAITLTCTADFNADGDIGTDADIEAFFACLSGNCCQTCASADFNGDGDTGTDADIESFFRVLAGGNC